MSTADTIKIIHDHAPGFLSIYRRLLLGGRVPYQPGSDMPRFLATWKGARADKDRVERYCAACDLPYDGHYPILYPHILCSAIHLDMISRPEFPLSPKGAVHTRNHLIQHAPIPVDAELDITCELCVTRILKQGVEFEIHTVLSMEGTRCWESISANLIRGKKFGDPVDASPLAELPAMADDYESHSWPVPKDMGWRYAKITGDFNPIHISRILARFMGFDRDLIHGMWSAARCVGHVPPVDPAHPVQLDLVFKGPVYMESTSSLRAQSLDSGALFELYCDDNPRPCIRGRQQPVAPGTRLVPEGA